MRSHQKEESDRVHWCWECDSPMANERILRGHLSRDHGEFWTRFKIHTHPYTCPDCSERFKNERGRTTHVGRKHPDILSQEEEKWRVERDCQCPACQDKFKSAWAVMTHTTRHCSEASPEERAETMAKIDKEDHPRHGRETSEYLKQQLSELRQGEKNPMHGKTGEENPFYGERHSEETLQKMRKPAQERINETGLYRMLRRSLGSSWNREKRDNRESVCEMCSADENLHLHHIVPVLSGGTNDGTI